jgi:hypothetical protein
MKRNVFVLAMDEFNLETMQRLREAGRYEFHPLLPREKVFRADSYDYEGLVRAKPISSWRPSTAAWMPSSPGGTSRPQDWCPCSPSCGTCPGPACAASWRWSTSTGADSPSGRSPVSTCRPSRRSIPSRTSTERWTCSSSQGIEYPFWIKPVKSVASYLGFRVDGSRGLRPGDGDDPGRDRAVRRPLRARHATGRRAPDRCVPPVPTRASPRGSSTVASAPSRATSLTARCTATAWSTRSACLACRPSGAISTPRSCRCRSGPG